MNLEIVKQEPWSSKNSKGGSKYQPILDTLRAMDVGDSVFINFEEFQKLTGDVRKTDASSEEIEKIYLERIRALMIKTSKKLGKAFVIRRQRNMEPWNEPAGVFPVLLYFRGTGA
jgi:hypothetical protein